VPQDFCCGFSLTSGLDVVQIVANAGFSFHEVACDDQLPKLRIEDWLTVIEDAERMNLNQLLHRNMRTLILLLLCGAMWWPTAAGAARKQKVIFDCDLAGDADDAFALALVLTSPSREQNAKSLLLMAVRSPLART
jgi:hypothetical protein